MAIKLAGVVYLKGLDSSVVEFHWMHLFTSGIKERQHYSLLLLVSWGIPLSKSWRTAQQPVLLRHDCREWTENPAALGSSPIAKSHA